MGEKIQVGNLEGMRDKPFQITRETKILDVALLFEVTRLGGIPGPGLCELKVRARRGPTTCNGEGCVGCGEPGAAKFDFCDLPWAANGRTLS